MHNFFILGQRGTRRGTWAASTESGSLSEGPSAKDIGGFQKQEQLSVDSW